MKKLYMILSVVSLCAGAFVSAPSGVYAQGVLNNSVVPAPFSARAVAHNYFKRPVAGVDSAPGGLWLSYWDAEDTISKLSGKTPLQWYDALFPDSDVTICYGANDCPNPPLHLIGSVLDPSSQDMQYYLNYTWSTTDPYTVDSLAIFYSYSRNSDPSIVDTLIVYLFNNSITQRSAIDTLGDSITVSVDLPVLSYIGPDGQFPDYYYGYDTVSFALIRYDSTKINTPLVTPSVLQTFKIPLTDNDAVTPGTSISNIVINTNHYYVPAGGLVASVFGFIPGYTYSPGDEITDDDNVFFIWSDEPVGANQICDSCPPYTPGDWNVSEIVDNTGRYQQSPGEFNGWFMPSYSFLGYQLQEHLISYYVTNAYDVGIKESIASGTTKLYQNEPNPANSTTLIRYETISAGTVTLEIRDLTGRLIMEINQGNQSVGTHTATIDVSELAQGMYLYTLKTNEESLTRRMIVSE